MTARRTLTRATVVLIAVVALRLVAGVWITAAVAAGLTVVVLVAGWAAIERRVFPRRPPAPARVAVVSGDRPRHVALARALAVVAGAYLAECEQDERTETRR